MNNLSYMFRSMFIINLLMPLIMIENISDYRISLNNIYVSIFIVMNILLYETNGL
jgi:hypothetical protein